MAENNWWEADSTVQEAPKTETPSDNWWEADSTVQEAPIVETPPLPEAKLETQVETDPKDIIPINMAVNKLSGIPLNRSEADSVLTQLWSDSEGNVEDFVEQYTGNENRDSPEFQNYVTEIKNNLSSNEPGGINSNISKEIYSKYPFLPKVAIHGTSG